MTRDDRRELWLMILLCAGVIAMIVVLTSWLSARSSTILTRDIQENLRVFAELAAMQFDADEIELIDDERDMRTNAFTSLVEKAQQIASSMPHIEYLYVMRKTENPQELAFVIENDMLTPFEEQDANGDGVIQPDEEIPVPGDTFALSDAPTMGEAFNGPTTDPDFTNDQWGWWMSGYAPIVNDDGEAVAIVGIDMRADDFVAETRRIFSPAALLVVAGGSVVILLSFILFYWRRRLKMLQRIEVQRSAMVTVALHKLGGPLATVRWWVELLGGSSLTKTQLKEGRAELSKAVERLSEVTQHLDEVTKVDGRDAGLWQDLAKQTSKDIAASKKRVTKKK